MFRFSMKTAAFAVCAFASVAVSAPAQADVKQVPVSRQDAQLSFAPVVKKAAPAVVNVYSKKTIKTAAYRSPFADDPIFRRFFGDQALGGAPQERVQNSLGSGVIVRANGVIVTNNHVVEGADTLRVVFSDRREFPARVLVADARTDIAVLKIDVGNEQLPTLTFADTRKVEIGDMVLAIGDPFGVGQTVTSGIVSATARTEVGISDFASFIQTDAAINPGNSGGALVDMNGQLIGINTAIFSKGGGSNGIGFAIPAEMVSRVIDNALNSGKLVRPWIGAMGQPVTAEIAKNLKLSKPEGVLLSQVYPGSPADKAGLKQGDVVLAVDDQAVFDENGIRYVAATKRNGDAVKVDYLR
ncbi:MAG: trypsin-like peptidase domain-containing protein, partial [Caulobacterales bacterium]